MFKIRVSYILTTKNRAKFLKKTFLNIREYITKDDELIVIDGGSKDGTKKIVQANKDIVAYFESEKDFGEAHALNKGILLSKGKYIKVLADDDYFYPKAMKQAIAVLEKNPDIDALQCGGEAYVYDEKIGKEEILFYEQVFSGVKIAKDLVHVTTYCPCGLGLVLTRRVISRAGLFDSSFRAADLNYISNLILCGANFKYLNISLYKHINYAHSGENYVSQIHRDEAITYLRHRMWEKTMGVKTGILLPILGLDKLEKGRELLQSIKFLDFLRRKKIYFPILLLEFLVRLSKTTSNIKRKLVVEKKSSQGSPVKPIPPVRDGKFW